MDIKVKDIFTVKDSCEGRVLIEITSKYPGGFRVMSLKSKQFYHLSAEDVDKVIGENVTDNKMFKVLYGY